MSCAQNSEVLVVWRCADNQTVLLTLNEEVRFPAVSSINVKFCKCWQRPGSWHSFIQWYLG